jgi:hypothetical protein
MQRTAVTIGYLHFFGCRMRVGAQLPHYRLLGDLTPNLWVTLSRGTPLLGTAMQLEAKNFAEYGVSAHANFKSNLASRKPTREKTSQ